MRLKHLDIEGFRGFSRAVDFDLDADAVILVGPNGTGKTSFFDAILWCLTGLVPRLGTEANIIVGKYSPTGEARVELTLADPNGQEHVISRRCDGTRVHLLVSAGEHEPMRDTDAESYLVSLLWEDARLAADPRAALLRSLTRGIYLQQDLVREFVEKVDDQERFDIVGEMIGAGRVNELRHQLEAARTAWSRATNAIEAELEPLVQRAAWMENRLASLRERTDDDAALHAEWRDWRRRELGLTGRQESALSSAPDAQALDLSLRTLQSIELDASRRLSLALEYNQLLQAEPNQSSIPVDELRTMLASARLEATAASDSFETAQRRDAEARQRHIARLESAGRWRTFAELSLELMDDTCPTCGQHHDQAATASRLRNLLAENSTVGQYEPDDDLSSLAAASHAAADRVADLEAAVDEAERVAAARERWESAVRTISDQLAVESIDGEEISRLIEAEQSRVVEARELRRQGERLALTIGQSDEAEQRMELEAELQQVRFELERQRVDIDERRGTGDLANQVLNALRTSADELVSSELSRIEPALKRIYATVDPHPSFTDVGFTTRMSRGRGHMSLSLFDTNRRFSAARPAAYLSSSQLAVLAVSVFLALNMSIEPLPLKVAALDDPLQSLDTINLLGLTDLLRRIKSHRQLVVSTHDQRLGELLARKLRPTDGHSRTIVYDLDAWRTSGPEVRMRDVPADLGPLRLIASG